MIKGSAFCALLGLLLWTTSARAHHGLDFIVLQDGTVPKPGSFMLFNSTQWSTFNGEDEWSTEPGLHLGVTPWLAIGTTASILDDSNGWHYSSTTPYLNVPLFQSDRVPWLKVSFYAGYELPDNVARAKSPVRSLNKTKAAASTRSSSGATTTAAASSSTARPAPPPVAFDRRRHNTGGTTGGGPDGPTTSTGHDHTATTAAPAPVAPASSSSTSTTVAPVAPVISAPVEEPFRGIHRHGEEGLHARLIIDIEVSEHDKLLANVINFTPAEGSPAWGYALGYRHAFTHDLAASLEAIGDFDGRGSHEVLAALHCTLHHAFTLKLGAAVGLTKDSPDASVHAGVVWRF